MLCFSLGIKSAEMKIGAVWFPCFFTQCECMHTTVHRVFTVNIEFHPELIEKEIKSC